MGQRILEIADQLVRRGNRRRLRQLLRKHPELRTSNDSMLIFTAIWRHRDMLRWLLQSGVSPDCGMGDGGNTPLMQAASTGELEIMRLLLHFGADPNALNEDSENPLGFAVVWGQPEAIRLLVAAGADVNNLDDSGPDQTQLDIAESSNWPAVAEALRQCGGKRIAELKT